MLIWQKLSKNRKNCQVVGLARPPPGQAWGKPGPGPADFRTSRPGPGPAEHVSKDRNIIAKDDLLKHKATIVFLIW